MPIEHIWLVGGIAAMAAGAVVAAMGFRREYAFMGGVALVIVGLGVLGYRTLYRRLVKEHRSVSDAYELGYQTGYDKGWAEGRRATRPVVVPLAAEREVRRADRYN